MLAYSIVIAVNPKAWEGLVDPDDFMDHRTRIMKSFQDSSDQFLRYAYNLWVASHETPFDETPALALKSNLHCFKYSFSSKFNARKKVPII